MTNEEEKMVEEIREAQMKLQEGLDMLKDAFRKLDGMHTYENYIIAHLENWINGGNPYDKTIPKIIEDLESRMWSR